MSYFALFDNAIDDSARLYQAYQYSVFIKPTDLDKLDSFLQKGWALGLYAVLLGDYEFGFALQDLPEKPDHYLVLHWFAKKTILVNIDDWLTKQADPNKPAGISQVRNDTDRQSYLQAIEKIKNAIDSGDIYQINYTVRLHLRAYGNPIRLYQRLRQPVPYAVLANLPDSAGKTAWTLSFSPELFLSIAKNGLITTRPMKGTAPFLGDGKDEMRADFLRADPKNRAENTMIVDLLRSDLGKIAQTGSVRITDLFKVSRFGSVLQMTTTVQAQPRAGTTLAELFRATYPCGSITGAPKRRSMQIIDDLESSRRGLYTGTIGWLEQCSTGLGAYGSFNIVIRSLELKPETADTYSGTYGVGSGIVADSVGADEFDECGWKARFLHQLTPEFSLFETMRVQSRQCALIQFHLERLRDSAQAVNIKLDFEIASKRLKEYLQQLPANGIFRVKMVVDREGAINFSAVPLKPLEGQQSVIISSKRLDNHNYVRRFKTCVRQFYDEGWQQAVKKGAFDSLFFNQDHQLLEGGRSSVFIQYQNQWHTPALSLDILDGVMRRQVMNNPQKYLHADQVHEGVITREMLEQAQQIKVCNALRGLFSVRLQAEPGF